MTTCETKVTCIAQVTFKFVNMALLVHNRWLSFLGHNLRFRPIFWLTNADCTVVCIFWLKSLSWGRTISADAWSLNGRTRRMGSGQLLIAGDETGWSDALGATNGEMIELAKLSVYFSQESTNFFQRNNSNWMKVKMHDKT